jgi:dephospho-CoA kinase
MDDDEKIRRCDFVILNDDRTMLIPQVLELHARFLEISKARPAHG